jgi:hypothetical protein
MHHRVARLSNYRPLTTICELFNDYMISIIGLFYVNPFGYFYRVRKNIGEFGKVYQISGRYLN